MKGIYKNYEYELLGYMGYNIKKMCSFRPMFGNKVFNMTIEEANKMWLRKIRYEINKYLKEK